MHTIKKAQVMDRQSLSKIMNTPEVHRIILGGYTGPYSLSIKRVDVERFGFVLRVQPVGNMSFPTEINHNGQMIPVMVEMSAASPRTLRAM